MKKLFVCVMASLCSIFAFADGADLVVKKTTIYYGNSGTMKVVINKANTTAFQFDMKLPAGISVSAFGKETSTRKFETALVDQNNNIWRFLSYDEKNAVLTAGTTYNITLKATADAEAGKAETEAILLVDPDGSPSEVENTPSANISLGAAIPIGSTGMTTYVCNSGLDFTNREEKAYIVSGIVDNNVFMTRVYKVPAGTPIVVKGTEGTHNLPGTVVSGIYYDNFLIGNNTDAAIEITPEGDDQFLRYTTNGFARFTSTKSVGAHKAYVRAKAKPAANTGSAQSVTIKSGNTTTSLCANVDLDFSNQTDIKAYIASGYNGSILITPVKKASAGTPLYIKGTAGTYNIPSAAAQTVYANMMVGNNSENSITINSTDGEYTNLIVSGNGFATFSGTKSVSKHKSYIQVLSDYMPAASRGISDDSIVFGETEVETLSVSLDSLGDSDDETTGIRSIDSQLTNDIWYNLKGQRVDTPTKKGLYIKNGRKVVVK